MAIVNMDGWHAHGLAWAWFQSLEKLGSWRFAFYIRLRNTLNYWKNMNSILVVGAKGMLGCEVVSALDGDPWKTKIASCQVHAVDLEEIDITKTVSVKKCFNSTQPQLVINCAAYTDVDGCETHRDIAMAVNGDGPGNLALACREHKAKLIHISTDFVFDGKKNAPYLPDDPTGPLSVYGESKLAGETAVRQNLEDHIILRTSWLFGQRGKNFVAAIRRLAQQRESLDVVNDQVGSPTYAVDLARAILHLVEVDAVGTFHFCNEGICSRYDFACEIVRQSNLSAEVHSVTSDRFPRPASRPAWSVLDTAQYRQTAGRPIRPWQEALADYLRDFKPDRGDKNEI
jgi:dTDP-4-dehydrorhamnose reductase